jgi:hypothetical protein
VRIDDFAPWLLQKSPEHPHPPRVDTRYQDGASAPYPAADDIVQLTLGGDGIWEVSPASRPGDGTSAGSIQASARLSPRVSRLYHTFLRVYSHEGSLRTMEFSRGLLVDVYA